MAGTIIKFKRGLAADLAAATIAVAEPFVVTDSQKMGFSPDGTAKILLASEGYVDTAIATANTKNWTAPVRLASTGNLNLTGTTQSIDGITAGAGDRVLLKDQIATDENGIYVVASGAWTRATDFNTTAAVQAAVIPVSEGTVNADRFYNQTEDAVVIDTDPMLFTEVSPGTLDGGTF